MNPRDVCPVPGESRRLKICRHSEIERALRLLDGPYRDAVGVDHGGFQARVPQKLLYYADVVIRLQQVGGEGVAEGVAGDTLGDFRLANGYNEHENKIHRHSQDGGMAGGVYLWNSRDDTERLYTDEWKNFIFDRNGSLPTVTYFESPVIVDNATGDIFTDG